MSDEPITVDEKPLWPMRLSGKCLNGGCSENQDRQSSYRPASALLRERHTRFLHSGLAGEQPSSHDSLIRNASDLRAPQRPPDDAMVTAFDFRGHRRFKTFSTQTHWPVWRFWLM